jgi:hypothetical protein
MATRRENDFGMGEDSSFDELESSSFSDETSIRDSTLAELRKLASKENIPGRSKMNKEELVEAIAKHLLGSNKTSDKGYPSDWDDIQPEEEAPKKKQQKNLPPEIVKKGNKYYIPSDPNAPSFAYSSPEEASEALDVLREMKVGPFASKRTKKKSPSPGQRKLGFSDLLASRTTKKPISSSPPEKPTGYVPTEEDKKILSDPNGEYDDYEGALKRLKEIRQKKELEVSLNRPEPIAREDELDVAESDFEDFLSTGQGKLDDTSGEYVPREMEKTGSSKKSYHQTFEAQFLEREKERETTRRLGDGVNLRRTGSIGDNPVYQIDTRTADESPALIKHLEAKDFPIKNYNADFVEVMLPSQDESALDRLVDEVDLWKEKYQPQTYSISREPPKRRLAQPEFVAPKQITEKKKGLSLKDRVKKQLKQPEDESTAIETPSVEPTSVEPPKVESPESAQPDLFDLPPQNNGEPPKPPKKPPAPPAAPEPEDDQPLFNQPVVPNKQLKEPAAVDPMDPGPVPDGLEVATEEDLVPPPDVTSKTIKSYESSRKAKRKRAAKKQLRDTIARDRIGGNEDVLREQAALRSSRLDEMQRLREEELEARKKDELGTTDRIVRRLSTFSLGSRLGGGGRLFAAVSELGIFQPEERAAKKERDEKIEELRQRKLQTKGVAEKQNLELRVLKDQEKGEIDKLTRQARFDLENDDYSTSESLEDDIAAVRDRYKVKRNQVASSASPGPAQSTQPVGTPSGTPATGSGSGSGSGASGTTPPTGGVPSGSDGSGDGGNNNNGISSKIEEFGEGLSDTTKVLVGATAIVEAFAMATGIAVKTVESAGKVLTNPEDTRTTVNETGKVANNFAAVGAGIAGAASGYGIQQVFANPGSDEEDAADQASGRNRGNGRVGDAAYAFKKNSRKMVRGLNSFAAKNAGRTGMAGVAGGMAKLGSGAIAGASGLATAGVGLVIGKVLADAVIQPLMAGMDAGVSYLEKLSQKSIGGSTLESSIEKDLILTMDELERSLRMDDMTASYQEATTELTLTIRESAEKIMQYFGPLLIAMLRVLNLILTVSNKIVVPVASHLPVLGPMLNSLNGLSSLGEATNTLLDSLREDQKNNKEQKFDDGALAEINNFFNSQDQFSDESNPGELKFNTPNGF